MTVSLIRHRGTLQAGLALEQQQVCLEVPHPKGLLCLQTSLKACGVAHGAPHPPSWHQPQPYQDPYGDAPAFLGCGSQE